MMASCEIDDDEIAPYTRGSVEYVVEMSFPGENALSSSPLLLICFLFRLKLLWQTHIPQWNRLLLWATPGARVRTVYDD